MVDEGQDKAPVGIPVLAQSQGGDLRRTVEHRNRAVQERVRQRTRRMYPLEPVLGQEVLLGQCLGNLLTNAAKFVAPGVAPRIRVRTERRGTDRVRVWIEDNGIGIDPRQQSRLFRVFERVPTRHPYDGTGIGLAIVRKAVEKMSGTCGVESNGVDGSRFWIELGRG